MPGGGNQKDPLQVNNPYPYRVDKALRSAYSLAMSPQILAQRFIGYLRHADSTTTPLNALTFPSQNCFIPMKDKIEPRLGSTLLGAPYTDGKNWPIIGHKKRFTTAGGISIEVRVTQSNDYIQNDIIEVLYPNPLTGVLQWYKISYSIWGLLANNLFDWSSVIPGVHRYYMDDWFDTNTNPSISLNTPRLIWTNGRPFIYSWLGAAAPIIDILQNGTSYYLTTSYGELLYAPLSATPWQRGEVVTGSTSGATALVASTAIVNSRSVMELIHVNGVFQFNESITGGTSSAIGTVVNYTPPPTTWGSLGFTNIAGEAPFFSVNENHFDLSGNIATNSYILGSSTTPAIAVGDVAFSIIRADATTIPLDVCRQNKNYMYYGNWSSRRYFMSNAFGHDATATITQSDSSLDNLIVSGTFTGTGSHTFKILVTAAGTPDTYQWQFDGGTPTTGVAMANTAHLLSNGISVTFPETTGHTLGDSWTITVNQAVTAAWTNFYYSLPARLPGEGYVFQLPSNFWAMEPQEDVMYVNTDYGEWGTIQTTLSANLLTESVVYEPLKHSASSKVLYPYMIGHTDNALIFVTENKKLDMISRMKFLELPQIGSLSNFVQLDFDELSFTNGSMEYFNKRLHITSPIEEKMLVYDEQQKYWQPPQVIPGNGILSIVGNTLISHSNLRNQTINLFTGTDGDLGGNYTVIARTSYESSGQRWDTKFSNASFVEGYVTSAPPMYMNIYLDINGSSGIRSHLIEPITAKIPDNGPIGEGYNGQHQLGSDVYNLDPHFYELDRKTTPLMMRYRFIAFELTCTAKTHSYSWLSVGVNKMQDVTGNTDITTTSEIKKN